MDVMRKMKSGWTESHCDTKIDGFIESVEMDGYSKALNEALAGLSMFCNSGYETTVIRCMEVVALADGKIDQRERDLVYNIATLLGITSINLPP